MLADERAIPGESQAERRDVRVAGLGALLDEADLVKFAKFSPDVESATATVNRAREIVRATTPAPAQTDDAATGASG